MANKLSVFLFVISIMYTINSDVIDCGTDNQCNCSSIATPGETCILNCNEKDICKGKILNCRDGDACHINCTSSTTCSDHTIINADTASHVTITCNGDDACKTDINIKCGIGKCQLQCITNKSCTDWGIINVTKASGFECIGYCPQSLPFFSTSPTLSPTMPPTSNTAHPTMYPSINPTVYPTVSAANISDETYGDETSNELYKMFNFHNHKHYLQDPLFYMILFLFAIIFCGCCFFCIWIYAHEQTQKRMQQKQEHMQLKLKSNIIIATEAEHINIARNNSFSSNKNKKSLDSSDLYVKNEGTFPTHLTLNTDGNRTYPLPLPPPRKSFSPIGIISNDSSPPPTPIPLTPKGNENHNYIIAQDNQYDFYQQIVNNNHAKYESLPTIPSLPNTPEHSCQSIQVSSPEHSLDINLNINNIVCNNNNAMHADSSHVFTVSMVSCMTFEDSKNEEQEQEEMEDSESIEYRSHRKQTFESYDMGNNSLFQLTNKSKSNLLSVNTEFDTSCIRKASTIKLPNIEESRSSVVSFDFSETSVVVEVMSDESGSIAKKL